MGEKIFGCVLAPGWVFRAVVLAALLALPASAVSSDGYYAFPIHWRQEPPSPVDMAGRVLPGPDCAIRRPEAHGEKLVRPGGKNAVHLWGISITVTDELPPQRKDYARDLVDRIAGYGFNHVHINGPDYPRVGLYERWRRTGELESEWMERLDYFLKLLRERKIFYSFSINNSSSKFEPIATLPGSDRSTRPYFGARIWDPNAVKEVARWYKAFFGHENQFTGLTYAEDPACLFTAGVEEDSAFLAYFRHWGRFGQANKRFLRKEFRQFLEDKYTELPEDWLDEGQLGVRDKAILHKNSQSLGDLDNLRQYSARRRRDTMKFLYELDASHARAIKSALNDVGYGGLFVPTNQYFGLGSLKAAQGLGNYLDIHGYFDPRKVRRYENKKNVIGFRNVSIFEAISRNESSRKQLLKRNLFRFFASSLAQRPIIVQGWNHMGWSDYAYEGPLLITAYGAFQGYSGLMIHTMFSSRLGHRAQYTDIGFAANGNPVLMGLSPSLGLAFAKGYIQEGEKTLVFPGARSDKGMWKEMANRGLRKELGLGDPPLELGFLRKIRVTPVGQPPPQVPEVPGRNWTTSTGQIQWSAGKEAGPRFTVDAPKFKAAAGRPGERPFQLGGLEISLVDHGAATAVALDDKAIKRSGSILFTVVSSYRNTSMEIRKEETRRGRAMHWVVDPGRAPVMMRRTRGWARLTSECQSSPRVMAVLPDGTHKRVEEVSVSDGTEGKKVRFSFGSYDTPWYWISCTK